jgi:hypothetical protein
MADNSNEIARYEAALTGCKFYIGTQALLIRAGHEDSFPSEATDSFSLGYLFGFVDGLMQVFSVEDESLRVTATGLVLQDIFGSEASLAHLTQGMSLMHRGETKFFDGMTHGGTDAFQKIRSGLSGTVSQFHPMTWVQHVNKQ